MAEANARLRKEYGKRQETAKSHFRRAVHWLEMAGADGAEGAYSGFARELDGDEVADYLNEVARLIPEGASTGAEPTTVLTLARTELWELAVMKLRERAVELCDEGHGPFCVDGLNDFLKAAGLPVWDEDEDEGLSPQEQIRYNREAEFVPADSDDEAPGVNVAGALVLAYLEDNEFHIDLELENVIPEMQRGPGDTVPIRFHVQGTQVYSAS